jgi:hypothetical protein
MERTHRKSMSPWRPTFGVATAVVGAVAFAGCGQQQHYAKSPRPPAPITIAAYISPTRVSVSPSSSGAGPINVLVTNQSSTSQEVTFETGGSGSSVTQSTGPINPGDTGEIKLFVRQGEYRLRASSGAIVPATMTVGGQRPSAQNQVLQP